MYGTRDNAPALTVLYRTSYICTITWNWWMDIPNTKRNRWTLKFLSHKILCVVLKGLIFLMSFRFVFDIKRNFRFVSFRKRSLKTTSNISFSNQNVEPETCCFVSILKKPKRTDKTSFFSSFSKKFKKSVDNLLYRYLKKSSRQIIAFLQNMYGLAKNSN